MTHYSIKDLAQLSGIKAHTIRIWEKRYELIEPQRTDTNIRYYSDQDLRKILNVSFLNNNGLKISKIANLSSQELTQHVSNIANSSNQQQAERSIDELIFAMIELDEYRFTHGINEYVKQMGFESAMTQVVYPFLSKIGVLWQTGNINPAQEHFVSNLIRQKIIAAIDQLPVKENKSSGLVLLFLPENELHEIGLLLTHYLVRKSGYRTIYLGQHMPYHDVVSIGDMDTPDFLVTYITNPMKMIESQEFVNRISKDFNKSKILLSMSAEVSNCLPMPSNAFSINSIDDLKDHILKA